MKKEQQLLEGFSPSPKDMIQVALDMPLERKIEKAIAVLKQYEGEALKLFSGGYWCCNSFGKDSGCIVELCKMADVKHECHHNLTTIDPPELIQFGKKHHKETVIDRSDRGHLILDAMPKKAIPPTRAGRWCCEVYKEHGGDGKVKVIGVRIEESARRAGLWKIVNKNIRGGLIVAPIAYWTEKDVWDFHKLRGLPYCSLYDEGFKRLGCVGCPLAGPKGQAHEFKRWPRFEKLWRMGFEKMWNENHGKPRETARICEFTADGKHPLNGIKKGEFIEEYGEQAYFDVRDGELDNPRIFDSGYLSGKLIGASRQRFFEKFRNADAFFDWWVSGGKWDDESGDDAGCVFDEMMRNV